MEFGIFAHSSSFNRMSGNESSNRTVQAEGIKSLVEEVVKCQNENNVPVYVGEFNIFDFYDLWSDLLNSLKRENISVCALFKIDNYFFGLRRCEDFTNKLPERNKKEGILKKIFLRKRRFVLMSK